MSATVLRLRRDDEQFLVMGASTATQIAAAIVFSSLALVIYWILPSVRLAPLVFGGLAIWQLLQLLNIHRIQLEADGRKLTYIHGFWLSPPAFRGTYAADAPTSDSPRGEPPRLRLIVEPYSGDPGMPASRLRSRIVVLRLTLPGDADETRRFQIGFPMGPLAAEERVEQLSRRFQIDIESTDESTEPSGTRQEIPPTAPRENPRNPATSNESNA